MTRDLTWTPVKFESSEADLSIILQKETFSIAAATPLAISPTPPIPVASCQAQVTTVMTFPHSISTAALSDIFALMSFIFSGRPRRRLAATLHPSSAATAPPLFQHEKDAPPPRRHPQNVPAPLLPPLLPRGHVGPRPSPRLPGRVVHSPGIRPPHHHSDGGRLRVTAEPSAECLAPLSRENLRGVSSHLNTHTVLLSHSLAVSLLVESFQLLFILFELVSFMVQRFSESTASEETRVSLCLARSLHHRTHDHASDSETTCFCLAVSRSLGQWLPGSSSSSPSSSQEDQQRFTQPLP